VTDANALLLVVLAAVVVSLAIALLLVRRSRARAAAALAPLGTPVRSSAATSLGRTGEDADQVRGTGTLVLTQDELGFAQWQPHRLLRIARTDIVVTDTTREHLGKSMKSDVLRVLWRSPDVHGGEESVAFFVRDLDQWVADLGGDRGTAG